MSEPLVHAGATSAGNPRSSSVSLTCEAIWMQRRASNATGGLRGDRSLSGRRVRCLPFGSHHTVARRPKNKERPLGATHIRKPSEAAGAVGSVKRPGAGGHWWPNWSRRRRAASTSASVKSLANRGCTTRASTVRSSRPRSQRAEKPSDTAGDASSLLAVARPPSSASMLKKYVALGPDTLKNAADLRKLTLS
jgi:hypothetical protein